jgi:hypothetical protein
MTWALLQVLEIPHLVAVEEDRVAHTPKDSTSGTWSNAHVARPGRTSRVVGEVSAPTLDERTLVVCVRLLLGTGASAAASWTQVLTGGSGRVAPAFTRRGDPAPNTEAAWRSTCTSSDSGRRRRLPQRIVRASIGDRFTRGDTAWVVVRVAVEEGGLGITVKPEGAARTPPGPSLGGSRTRRSGGNRTTRRFSDGQSSTCR